MLEAAPEQKDNTTIPVVSGTCRAGDQCPFGHDEKKNDNPADEKIDKPAENPADKGKVNEPADKKNLFCWCCK